MLPWVVLRHPTILSPKPSKGASPPAPAHTLSPQPERSTRKKLEKYGRGWVAARSLLHLSLLSGNTIASEQMS